MVKNPIAKAVRTPRFKIQIIKDKRESETDRRLRRAIADAKAGRFVLSGFPSDRG